MGDWERVMMVKVRAVHGRLLLSDELLLIHEEVLVFIYKHETIDEM
jgi:hypothetical protein